MSSFLLSSPPSSSKIRRRVENNVPLIAPKHICQLPHETETWAPYIQSGIFVNLRRKFRKWTLPDPNLPHCRKYLKSSAIIRNEQEMQMKCHYYMVHPFSLSRWVSARTHRISKIFSKLKRIPFQGVLGIFSNNRTYHGFHDRSDRVRHLKTSLLGSKID